jgi:hypothetical protein
MGVVWAARFSSWHSRDIPAPRQAADTMAARSRPSSSCDLLASRGSRSDQESPVGPSHPVLLDRAWTSTLRQPISPSRKCYIGTRRARLRPTRLTAARSRGSSEAARRRRARCSSNRGVSPELPLRCGRGTSELVRASNSGVAGTAGRALRPACYVLFDLPPCLGAPHHLDHTGPMQCPDVGPARQLTGAYAAHPNPIGRRFSLGE